MNTFGTLRRPVFTLRQIQVASLLGGPLAAGYFFIYNFIAVGKGAKAFVALVVTLSLCFELFQLAYSNIDRALPNLSFIPIILALISTFLFKFTQQTQIAEHIARGGNTFSWLVAIIISLLCVFIMILAAYPATLLYTSPKNTGIKNYGERKHIMVYEVNAFSSDETDKLADFLTSFGYLDNKELKTITLKKDLNTVEIGLQVNTIDNTAKANIYYKNLLAEAKNVFPANKIELLLSSPSGDTKRIE